MRRTPTTPNVGVEERHYRVGQNRPSGEPQQTKSEKHLNCLLDHSSHEHDAPGSETPTATEARSGHPQVASALLTDEKVRKFQDIYKVRFGKDLTYEEAQEQGVNLVRLMELIYTPMTLDEYRRLQKRREDTGCS